MHFSTLRHIHFVGIGGIGMSGIAEILMAQGFRVSGSDMQRSDITDYLEEHGATVYIGHDAEHVEGADVVVYSSAVRPSVNAETRAARERGVPLIRRAEMLSEVSRLKYCLAIAGTHGKTTTTSMCALIMIKAGLDPTVIVGGRLKGLGGSNARLGAGEWMVLEADEYDRSFLQLLPSIAVITNVEADHLDIYDDLDDIKEAFVEFANKVPFYGVACVCLDDDGVQCILPRLQRRVITYGLSEACTTRAVDLDADEQRVSYSLVHKGENLGRIALNVPGEHNVKNSLAAASMALEIGISPDIIREALGEFHGVYRRFEIKGENAGVLVIDDYAHHPTEIVATLAAAKAGWDRRLIAVFQPHTYTRTRDFFQAFAESFCDADVLVITDVYPAREAPIEGVSGALIADAARLTGHKHVYYVPNPTDVKKTLSEVLTTGDIVLTMGAGDIWKVGMELLA